MIRLRHERRIKRNAKRRRYTCSTTRSKPPRCLTQIRGNLCWLIAFRQSSWGTSCLFTHLIEKKKKSVHASFYGFNSVGSLHIKKKKPPLVLGAFRRVRDHTFSPTRLPKRKFPIIVVQKKGIAFINEPLLRRPLISVEIAGILNFELIGSTPISRPSNTLVWEREKAKY